MRNSLRSVAIVMASAGVANAAAGGDEKAVPLLIASVPASAWIRPVTLAPTAPQVPLKSQPSLASFLPALPSSYFSAAGTNRLLFLSPLSPLRAALRVAAQDLAAPAPAALVAAPLPTGAMADPEAVVDEATAARRREVVLRQRRRSVLNERDRETSLGAGVAENDTKATVDAAGLSGHVEVMALPSSASPVSTDSALPGGAGLVRVAGYLTQDLRVALTGLAAETAATTWRAGAEFELAIGERQTIEAGAVYGTRFNAISALPGAAEDRRPVGAIRVAHTLRLTDTVSTRAGGRFVDATFLKKSRAIDPEFSLLIEDPGDAGRAYVRFDLAGDTLFPGLELVTGESDLLALSDGLPVLARDFAAQRTWTRAVAGGFKSRTTRLEGRVLDQSVANALMILPSRAAGAPFAWNADRNRAHAASVALDHIFAQGQAEASVEYGYGRFSAVPGFPYRVRDFHQVTARFDAYLRRTGTGIAIFHRVHEGAGVSAAAGEGEKRTRSQRYLVELRQDVPWVPSLIGADMALLVSVRNLYYDDVDRRFLDEFSVQAPPRRVTGGIRVKF